MRSHAPFPWEFLAPTARELGFAAVGICPAKEVPAPAAHRFGEWLKRGSHAGMAFMADNRAARHDLRHPGIVAGASAVVVAALPYGGGAAQQGLWRHVAAHARSRDYHRIVRERLHTLAGAIRDRFPDCRCRVFVDSAPVMERTWAICSGVGSLGRNGAIIVPGVGCRVLLGEIVLASVPAPEPIDPPGLFDLCGDCSRCLAACPTGALLAPAVVDSARCLSYWTIEHRPGEIPPDLADHVTSIFGCDACTSVCPVENPGISSSLDPPPYPGPIVCSLGDIAVMEGDRLEEIIAGTALARTGADAIRRNARLALRNGDRNQGTR